MNAGISPSNMILFPPVDEEALLSAHEDLMRGYWYLLRHTAASPYLLPVADTPVKVKNAKFNLIAVRQLSALFGVLFGAILPQVYLLAGLTRLTAAFPGVGTELRAFGLTFITYVALILITLQFLSF